MEVDVYKKFKHRWPELSLTRHPVLPLTVDFSFLSTPEELWLIFCQVPGLPCGSPITVVVLLQLPLFSQFFPVSQVSHAAEEPGTGFVLSRQERGWAVFSSSSGEIKSGKCLSR